MVIEIQYEIQLPKRKPRRRQASRTMVDQWLRDNAPELKAYDQHGVIGFYRRQVGPAQSLKSRGSDGQAFKSWGDVLEYLIFTE